MHYVIVGGGISGLYSAYKLKKRYGDGVKIDVFEKADRLGGRIHTVVRDGVYLEAGAGRINGNHRRVLKLINELGLTSELITMHGKHDVYIRDGKKYDASQIFKSLVDGMKTYSRKELRSQTLMTLARHVLTPSQVDDLIYSFGYNSEFEVMNAYDALKSLRSDERYYLMKQGTASVVLALEKFLMDNGVAIRLRHEVTKVHKGKLYCNILEGANGNGKAFKFDKAIICLDRAGLQKIGIDEHNVQKTLDSTVGVPFCRVYARFPMNKDGRVWFHDLSRVTTNQSLRQIIPINMDKGIAMASYSDGTWALNWGKMSSTELEKELLRSLRGMFPSRDIPDPVWVERFYWENGVHFPMVHYVPLKQNGGDIIICGEAFVNENNGWIEGALLSVDKVVP
jgi:phytoene dehydrogenase-like protein